MPKMMKNLIYKDKMINFIDLKAGTNPKNRTVGNDNQLQQFFIVKRN